MQTAPQAGPFSRDRFLYFALAVSLILHFDVIVLLDAILNDAPGGVAQARHLPSRTTLSATLTRNPTIPLPPAASVTDVKQTLAPQPATEVNPPRAPTTALSLPPSAVQAEIPAEMEIPNIVDTAEPRYFPLGELSRRPQLLSVVEINATAEPAASAPGRARLKVLINEQGGVDRVVIDKSDLPPAFEQATMDAFLKAQYAPGEIDGVPVRSQVRIEVTYDGPANPQTPLN